MAITPSPPDSTNGTNEMTSTKATHSYGETNHPNARKNFQFNLEEIVSKFGLPCEVDFTKTEQLPSYDDYNFHIFGVQQGESESESYVVKCMHAGLVSLDHVKLQVAMMNCLASNGVPAAKPYPLKNVKNDEKEHVIVVGDCVAHVISFIPNSVLYPEKDPKSPAFLNYLGDIVGRVHVAMHESGFFTGEAVLGEGSVVATSPEAAAFHRKTGTFVWEWSVCRIPAEFEKRLDQVEPSQKEQCEELLKRISEVLPLDDKVFEKMTPVSSNGAPNLYRKDCYHSDLNDSNVLFAKCNLKKDEYECSAVLDFGDSGCDYVLYDIAIASAYAGMHQDLDPVTTLFHIIRGYCQRWRGWLGKVSNEVSNRASNGENGESSDDACWTLGAEGVAWPREALKVCYAVSLARQMLSFIMGNEQMAGLRQQGKEGTAEYEYAAHTVAPVWKAAVSHLEFKSVDEAVDRLEGMMRNEVAS